MTHEGMFVCAGKELGLDGFFMLVRCPGGGGLGTLGISG